MQAIWERSDIKRNDIDLLLPYDGFSIITLAWLENAGYCRPGEAGQFVEANWDSASETIRINGRVAVNTHGGALSEGRTQGAGHVFEAVTQLRGDAGDRQEPDVAAALATAGGLFFNFASDCLEDGPLTRRTKCSMEDEVIDKRE